MKQHMIKKENLKKHRFTINQTKLLQNNRAIYQIFTFERTDGSYSIHQVVKGNDFYIIEKQAWQGDKGHDNKQYKGATPGYYFIAEEGHVFVSNHKGTKYVDYELSNDIVKLPQSALKKYPNIDTMLRMWI